MFSRHRHLPRVRRAVPRVPLPPTSPRCRKLRFPDELAAKLALAAIRRRDNPKRGKLECRCYPCSGCGGWHLTARRDWRTGPPGSKTSPRRTGP